nr:hypothetical protein [Providencia rettgeri]
MNIEDIPHIGEIWAGIGMIVFILLTLLSRFAKQEDKLEYSDVVIASIFWPIFIPMVIIRWFVLYSEYLYNKITRNED